MVPQILDTGGMFQKIMWLELRRLFGFLKPHRKVGLTEVFGGAESFHLSSS